ncbi:SpoIIIAH-like family protein [Lederbergia citrea]|uniref:SpoIIIAH-like family protein n=1 Tax=Lederbergia citrea TaxID=2833581 RepID=A0A942UJ39_9BACI|nr:SpoIIIAH-like family protein [Lederbergia citrea]MBS4176382.1 SpoIIIAH-like family protein [Lederbergia citrea]MBS4202943.1 SpoIIIAH-like family protein [Lederbergia citrea]MBS4222385.1 SpoIIIAH-like family protein [Lederbergia citrea]
MLLKKQTVWLLTMLSLVVVLSVYYVTSDTSVKDLAAIGKDEPAAGNDMSDKDLKVLTEAAGDEVFETARISLQDKRGKQIEDMTTELASNELTVEEKQQLYAEMKEVTDVEMKEKTIESAIKSLGYSDALVKVENGEVNVTVKTSEDHSRSQAVQILKLVREEVGTNMVAVVDFQKK